MYKQRKKLTKKKEDKTNPPIKIKVSLTRRRQIYFEHYLRKFREELKNIPVNIYVIKNQWLEQRQSNQPNGLIIYADDYDFITEDE